MKCIICYICEYFIPKYVFCMFNSELEVKNLSLNFNFWTNI